MCSYVESSITDAAYFSSPCKFGKDGVEEVMGFGEICPYEQMWFDKVMHADQYFAIQSSRFTHHIRPSSLNPCPPNAPSVSSSLTFRCSRSSRRRSRRESILRPRTE